MKLRSDKRNMARGALAFLLTLFIVVAHGCSAGNPAPPKKQAVCDPTCTDACCDGQCVNLNTDAMHCGTCERACMPGQSCGAGNCNDCPVSGQAMCNMVCTDLQSNNLNCGACNRMCGAGQSCQAGACTCQAPLGLCNGSCTDLSGDGNNCGACGTVCPAGQVCSNSACSAGGCPAGQMTCGNSCFNTQTDPLNCGGCGTPCPQGLACAGGMCACAAGQQLCGTDCSDPMTSDINCGTCGNRCLNGKSCSAGNCVCPQGQMDCNGSCMAVGSCGAGGSGGGGAGGSSGAGGAAAGGTSAGGGSAGGGAGGMGTGGTVEGRNDCPVSPGLISDFEEGQGLMVQHEGRNGWWYVFADDQGGSQTPASVMDGPVAVEMTPNPPGPMMCAQYSMHSTASGHTQYVGFGGTFIPGAAGTENKSPIDVSAYDGVSFKIRSGSGSAPPVLFEMLNRETQPAPAGTATNDTVDTYNTRSKLMTGITTEWQEVFVPFGILAPRYLPDGLATTCSGGVFCEAPAFNPASALGVQWSVYDQFMAQGSNGSYDLWVDDVKFYSGDQGYGTLTQTGNYPFPRNAAVGSCTKPAGADGRLLIPAYLAWKQTFVEDCGGGAARVKRPERSNDSVSEGIAYGMLLAVYFGDKPLFDSLWNYWKKFPATGLLMHWHLSGCDGVQEQGSATDADEDAAFALLMAAKQWGGGSYQSDATSMISSILSTETSGGVLKPGNSFGGSDLTNPSYFAPAFYRVFQAAGGGSWDSVISSTYSYLQSIQGSNGLVPAWCSNGCSSRGGGGYENADLYQYDSHRTPWRMALDACWNDNAQAKTYVGLTSNFFAGKSTTGIGTILDIYDGGGGNGPDPKANSMSIVGTAACGAMVTAGSNAGHKRFLDSAFRFILDANYTADPSARDPQSSTTAYTYYNATVGLLTALTMSGNFNLFQ